MKYLFAFKPSVHFNPVFYYIFLCLFFIPGLQAQTSLLTTVAGNSAPGFSGDGAPAKNAQLNNPVAICFDNAGNMYIADAFNYKIRKVEQSTGIISTIAGIGTAGFSGDGGPALNAQFDYPSWLCVDNNRNELYVVDYWNYRIRSINLSTGIITTLAGNGTDAYVNGGLANSSGLLPAGMALDAAGDLYVTQHPYIYYSTTTNIISKINRTTGIVTTIAGNGTPGYGGDGGPAMNASFQYPQGICFDAAGNIYFTDCLNNRVRRIDASSGIITTVAGKGLAGDPFPVDGALATEILMKAPTSVVLDAAGDLVICDQNEARVTKVKMATGTIKRLAGTGYIGNTPDCQPAISIMNQTRVAALDPAGELYITEQVYHRIRKVITVPDLTIFDPKITASSTTICPGSIVNFQVSNAYTAAYTQYKWTINGSAVGTNSNQFSSQNLKNNDEVLCELNVAYNETCPSNFYVISNSIKIIVEPLLTPSVSITTPNNNICTGANAVFKAIASNAGANPTFFWKVNGNSVSVNSPTFITNSLTNGDIVSCLINADINSKCIAQPTALSNSISMQVSQATIPSVTIAESVNDICPGKPVSFLATASNIGNNVNYVWNWNGDTMSGKSPVYSVAGLKNGDKVFCTISDPANSCFTGAGVASNIITMIIKPVPEVIISPADTAVFYGSPVMLQATINGSYSSFSWLTADGLTNPNVLNPVVTATKTSTYNLNVVTADGCSNSAISKLYVKVKVLMPNAFSPNGDGKNDVFRIPPSVVFLLKRFVIYNRWGNEIFTTIDIKKGWDGRYKGNLCDNGAYVYVIEGMNNSEPVLLRGSVVLLR